MRKQLTGRRHGNTSSVLHRQGPTPRIPQPLLGRPDHQDESKELGATWPVRLLSHDAQESPLTLKRPSYLCPRRGSAREGRTTTRPGEPGWVVYAWA